MKHLSTTFILSVIMILTSCEDNIDVLKLQVEEELNAVPLTSRDSIAKYTTGDIIVDTKNDLLDILASNPPPVPGTVIFIPGGVELNIEEQIFIPDGIILASDRNNGSSLGAKIYRTQEQINKWIVINGNNVEISGLRIQGPSPNTNPVNSSIGISAESRTNLNVNGCEISAFSRSSVYFKNSDGVVSNNYIHHNQREHLGYGVLLDEDSNVLIENNLFDFNRHDIAGTGHREQSYEARYNIILPNGTHHSFDMHAEHENEGNGVVYAGNSIYIHHNTFMNSEQEAVMIRAIPQQNAIVEKNIFYHSTLDGAVKQYLRNGQIEDWEDSRIPFPFQSITLSGNKFNGALNGGSSKDVIILTPSNEMKKYIFDYNLFFYKTFPRVGHDFNFEDYFVGNWTNNGTSDLLVRENSGIIKLYQFHNGSFYNSSNIGSQVGHGFNFENYFVGNWSNNGTSDLLVRDNGGNIKLYQFHNGSFYNSSNIGSQVGHGFNFENYFVGNWTGNGTSDLIVRNQAGKLFLYKFNGTNFYGQGNPTQVGYGFNFENYFVGNWTGNGTSDLITRDAAGTLRLYRFNGSSFYGLGVVGNNFNYQDYCIGDFTGDGIDDLLTIDSENSIYLFPFKNNTFYNNGGPIKIGHNLFFEEFLVGEWGY